VGRPTKARTKRDSKHSVIVYCRLPDDLLALVDGVASKEKTTRSGAIRKLIEEAFEDAFEISTSVSSE
jgi:metal-responsive CopG/Arc/MetJ family transcriptional regulator